MPLASIAPNERNGASDFPSIYLQKPREGMQLHWDGNNPSLDERNLSAALGAGVTPDTVDHAAIGRVKDWLLDLRPPKSPHRGDAAAAERGRALYMTNCAACHGYQGSDGHVFRRQARQGDPIATLRTDRASRFPPRHPPAPIGGAVQGTLPVQALRQDRRLRRHAARRAVVARSLPAQRFGADAARPAGAAGGGRSRSCAVAT